MMPTAYTSPELEKTSQAIQHRINDGLSAAVIPISEVHLLIGRIEDADNEIAALKAKLAESEERYQRVAAGLAEEIAGLKALLSDALWAIEFAKSGHSFIVGNDEYADALRERRREDLARLGATETRLKETLGVMYDDNHTD